MTTNTDTAKMTTTTAGPAGPAPRLAVDELVPHVARAMNALDAASRRTAVEPALLELVRARASQLNGCAYCVDMHSRDARQAGETEQRLYALPVWAETPFFTARERAALDHRRDQRLEPARCHRPPLVADRVTG
jgi:AhpD family alkylhydroperoxidase